MRGLHQIRLMPLAMALFLTQWLFAASYAQENDVLRVEGAVVQAKEFVEVFRYSGTLKAKEQVSVLPKAPGKLLRYEVNVGDKVEKGALICQIDRDITGFSYEPLKVYTPISGVVLKAGLDIGQEVGPSTAVAIIGDVSKIIVRATIPEADYHKVEIGQNVELETDALPGRVFEGAVSKKDLFIDPMTRSAEIEAQFDNAEGLLIPGAFAKIRVMGNVYNALAVPLDALMKMPGTGQYYTYVVKDGRAHKRFVEIGAINGAMVEITKGLSEGDVVIVSSQGRVKEGSQVDVITK